MTFEVKHEFNVSLTVMGDSQTIPWRLLEIEILVEDKETGGKSVVTPFKMNLRKSVIFFIVCVFCRRQTFGAPNASQLHASADSSANT